MLGRLLFNHIKRKRDGETRAYIHLDEFLEVATDVMSIITDTQQMKYYFDMFAEGKDQLSLEGTELRDNAIHWVSAAALILSKEYMI